MLINQADSVRVASINFVKFLSFDSNFASK